MSWVIRSSRIGLADTSSCKVDWLWKTDQSPSWDATLVSVFEVRLASSKSEGV